MRKAQLITLSIMGHVTHAPLKVIKLSGRNIKLSVGKQGKRESRKVIKLSSL